TLEERKARLQRLAAAVLLDTEREFDLSTYGRHHGRHKPEARAHCGTAVCALGTGALIPEFQTAGLSFNWERSTDDDGNPCWEASVVLQVGKDKFTNHNAGRKF